MIRLLAVVEGKSEAAFVTTILREHLQPRGVFADATLVKTRVPVARPDAAARGGGGSWADWEDHLRSLRPGRSAGTPYVTTMLDYYGFPPDCPLLQDVRGIPDPRQRVAALETAILHALGAPRQFVPYVQLHEFETLLLSDVSAFSAFYPRSAPGIAALAAEAAKLGDPELIDDGATTAPSKRIAEHLPDYPRQKPTAGTVITAAIGIPRMRQRCRHFDEWLTRLEGLAAE